MAYCVYILYSETTDRYYVGYTSDIESRLGKHNMGGTRSTRPGRPWQLCYTEKYSTKSEAIKRENDIKSKKSRKYIESLIGSSTA